MENPILALKDIHKTFGGVVAIENFSLDLYPGEIVALVGDNGAGKSTLIKIVSGVHKPTSGSIRLDGSETSFSDASGAREAGIEVVLLAADNAEEAGRQLVDAFVNDVVTFSGSFEQSLIDAEGRVVGVTVVEEEGVSAIPLSHVAAGINHRKPANKTIKARINTMNQRDNGAPITSALVQLRNENVAVAGLSS